VTYIEARLVNTGDPATENGRVVGVPTVKSDIAIDYHPYFAHGFAFTGAVHYESSRAETNTNNSFASPYATLDLGLRYSTTFQKHAATWRFQVFERHRYALLFRRSPTATSLAAPAPTPPISAHRVFTRPVWKWISRARSL